MRIAVFGSGKGSTLNHLIDEIKHENLNCKIGIVVSNTIHSELLGIANEQRIPYCQANDDNIILSSLFKHRIDMIVLAGYTKLISPVILDEFENKIINVHPSLLPKYAGMYGRKIHEEVIASPDEIAGATIHYVDENYDTGTIIVQEEIQIDDNETVNSIEARVKDLEKTMLCNVLNSFAKGHIKYGT